MRNEKNSPVILSRTLVLCTLWMLKLYTTLVRKHGPTHSPPSSSHAQHLFVVEPALLAPHHEITMGHQNRHSVPQLRREGHDTPDSTMGGGGGGMGVLQWGGMGAGMVASGVMLSCEIVSVYDDHVCHGME